MGLRDLFRRSPPAAAPERPLAQVQPSGPSVVITSPDELAEYLRHGSGTSTSGAVVTTATAMRQAAVWRCSAIISGAVANMPLALKRRVDERTRLDASDHPLWSVLTRRPNGWQTPSGFRRLLTNHVLWRGNGYALKVPGSRGAVSALIPLMPDRMQVEQLDDLRKVFRYTRKDGRQIDLTQDEVFHLIGMSADGVTGMSVLEAARNAIGLAIQTETHGGTVFTNGASVGAILKHPQQLGEKAQDTLRDSVEKFRGAENAHRTLILEEGMDYTPLGMTNEDAQFLETRGYQRRDIFMFFGVPPFLAGDTDAATSWGSGLEQQSQGFVTYSLEDWLTMWEETINRDLLADDESELFARFKRNALVRGDTRARGDFYMKGRQGGWYSPNDIRAFEDENPIEGGDSYSEPLNMQPLGTGAEDRRDDQP